MIYEKAMRLVKALRGRGYRQGSEALRTGPRTFCCLGVACQIAGAKCREGSEGDWKYEDQSYFVLPDSVKKYFDFFTNDGWRRDGAYIIIDGKEYISLSSANDHGVPFRKIADYIEKNYKQL